MSMGMILPITVRAQVAECMVSVRVQKTQVGYQCIPGECRTLWGERERVYVLEVVAQQKFIVISY